LRVEAPTTESIFGGTKGVALGLAILRDKLAGKPDPRDLEIARYVIALLQLQARLRREAAVQQAIRRGVETVQSQMKFFEATKSGDTLQQSLVDKLAELYTQTLSNLPPRIMVNGEHGHLANPVIAAKVRTALFAGVRAAFLWRQLGGNRWQLLFARRKIANEAAHLLEETR
jgi:high frequency lysogenization protein